MNLVFQTNLDAPGRDMLELNRNVEDIGNPAVPRVGEMVVIPFTKGVEPYNKFTYDLEVYEVNYNYKARTIYVHLHIPKHRGQSVAEWSEWFKNFRYGFPNDR